MMSETNETPVIVTQKRDHLLSNKVYDGVKFLAMIILPAAGTLYFALAGIWGLPKAEEVVGTIVALDTFFGLILSISDKSYNKSEAKFDGTVLVSETPTKTLYSLELNSDPNDLKDKNQILLSVAEPVVPPEV
jgi:hypothetical protein